MVSLAYTKSYSCTNSLICALLYKPQYEPPSGYLLANPLAQVHLNSLIPFPPPLSCPSLTYTTGWGNHCQLPVTTHTPTETNPTFSQETNPWSSVFTWTDSLPTPCPICQCQYLTVPSAHFLFLNQSVYCPESPVLIHLILVSPVVVYFAGSSGDFGVILVLLFNMPQISCCL